MTEKEFEEIIQPIDLLPLSQIDFMKKALKANFRKWQENQALGLTDVVEPLFCSSCKCYTVVEKQNRLVCITCNKIH